MKTEDIQHLAGLSRIALSDKEVDALAGEFDAILGYIAQITEVSADVSAPPVVGVLANVMREDVETHEPGEYTEVLLNAAPTRNGGYIQVKKILTDKTTGSRMKDITNDDA
jgi:aspartyl-tRNA(Asn)/glutamyl-tRNA(Gln) amidotransferase subunit C